MLNVSALVKCKNNNFYLIILLGAILINHLAYLYTDIMNGGQGFKQGDWLINSHAGLIRRFLIGDILFFVNHITGIHVLFLLGFLQAFFMSSVFILTYICHKFLPEWLFWFFVTSPAFFIIFWFGDPGGAFRKEIILYCAILMQFIAIKNLSKALYYTSGLLVVVSFFSHEALVLFVPLILWINYIFYGIAFRARIIFLHSTIIVLSALTAFVFSWIYSNSIEVIELCAILIEKNFDPNICGGAIEWLGYPHDYGFSKWSFAKTLQKITDQILAFIIFFTPFFILMKISNNTLIGIKVALLSGLVFIPLYFVAVDWGRWLNFHFFSVFIVVLVLADTGRLKFSKRISMRSMSGAILLPLLIGSPNHMQGIRELGPLKRILEILSGIYI